MNLILIILTLFGSIGLFMFGMRVMSESLQKAAGLGLRRKLSAITRNRLSAIFSGTLITGGIQSSSATTIMVVSFVNAGLISLQGSAGLIIGANIGTTITAWLVVIFGFKFNIQLITLPLIGIAFPFYFSSKKSLKYWSEFVIGFALIFISLEFIKNVFPDINSNPRLFEITANLTDHGFISTLLFIVLGFIITAIIQSSSVATTLTIVMCAKGLIGLEYATAMVLGENLGTTVTALIASMMANKPAKRAAMFHVFFNLIGILIFTPFLPLIVKGIDSSMVYFNNDSPLLNSESVPMALAIFHSAFNVTIAVVLYRFINYIIKLTYKIFKKEEEGDERSELTFMKTGILSTSELSILQVTKEIQAYGKKTDEMFKQLKNLFFEINEEAFQHMYSEIKHIEKESDAAEHKITKYLTRLSEGELSVESSMKIRAMMKLVDELENICDIQFNMAKSLRKKRKKKIWFTQDIRNNIRQMFDLLNESFAVMLANLSKEYEEADIDRALRIEKQINKLRKDFHKKQMKTGSERDYKYEAGIMYSDILNKCERLGDYIFNVSKNMGDLSGP